MTAGQNVYVRQLIRFAEMTLLTSRVTDYPIISHGVTRIPGVNDAEEFELTCVSVEPRKERAS